MANLTYAKYSTPFGTEYSCKSGIFHTCWNLRNVKARAEAEGADEILIVTAGVQRPKHIRYIWTHGEYQKAGN